MPSCSTMPSYSAALMARLPIDMMRLHHVVPIREEPLQFVVGSCQELVPQLLNELTFLLGKRIAVVAMPADEIKRLLEEHSQIIEDAKSLHDSNTTAPTVGTTPGGSVLQQVDELISTAIFQKASDIHIEPYESVFRVRYRIDGVLKESCELALRQKDAIVSRLKIMASLDIAEKRRPQDGRIRFDFAGQKIDLRVSTLPTDFGEKVVMRILDKQGVNLNLEFLGFSDQSLQAFKNAVHQPYGMILVTGPTGSGKTTTLYAALSDLNNSSVNITTIEDPIEYNLSGVNQTRVRNEIGFTFAKALRAFLRQDPNIIMVGEMRDQETIEIAIRAALTGHLVLSTIHTNDAPSTIIRLMDMGIEPFLVSASLKLVVAQRLVRKICEVCKLEVSPDALQMNRLRMPEVPEVLFAGKGCDSCNDTGYRGRIALFEVLPIDDELSEMISRRAGVNEIRSKAMKTGMKTLRDVALERMRAGITTSEEVLRETTL